MAVEVAAVAAAAAALLFARCFFFFFWFLDKNLTNCCCGEGRSEVVGEVTPSGSRLADATEVTLTDSRLVGISRGGVGATLEEARDSF